MGAIGSFGGGSVTATVSPLYTQGKVQNVTISAANNEQSHTFPTNTRKFEISARGNGKILLSYTSGESGTVYRTIWAGSFYCADQIAAATTTIYFQSPTNGLVIELVSWT